MAQKAIDKSYLLQALKNFDTIILSSRTKIANNTYSAGDSNVNVPIDLDDGSYTIQAFCGEEGVTKQSITYGTKTITVTFDNKPSTAGTLWVIARKVV